jgi:hypothetical protein
VGVRAWVQSGGLALLLLLGCGPPCEVPVHTPSAPEIIPWIGDDASSTTLRLGDRDIPALLDTGFRRSAISVEAAAGLDLTSVTARLGATSLGPWSTEPSFGTVSILGTDVLRGLPFIADARARTFEIRPRFKSRSEGDVVLETLAPAKCVEGPLYVLQGKVEDMLVRWVLDTGSDVTVMRTTLSQSLSARPSLEGLRLVSGLVGPVVAAAKRASVQVGTVVVNNLPLLSSTGLDSAMDELEVDGFLGWTFLRELALGLDVEDGNVRFLQLSRFDTQTHWSRDYVGIGVNLIEVENGSRVDGFLSVSPARDAGIQVGDVVTSPLPSAPAGTVISVQVQRGDAALSFNVEVTDLLPD